jgi:hypothetical protein
MTERVTCHEASFYNRGRRHRVSGGIIALVLLLPARARSLEACFNEDQTVKSWQQNCDVEKWGDYWNAISGGPPTAPPSGPMPLIIIKPGTGSQACNEDQTIKFLQRNCDIEFSAPQTAPPAAGVPPMTIIGPREQTQPYRPGIHEIPKRPPIQIQIPGVDPRRPPSLIS